MTEELKEFYLTTLTSEIVAPSDQRRFMNRLNEGKLLRAENPLSHMCAMVVPFDLNSQQILVVHHKKAKTWIFPGGHIEDSELPPVTIRREIKEELGVNLETSTKLNPFSAQILDINNPPQVCREHYDLFYAVPLPSRKIVINLDELLEAAWLSVEDAKEKISMNYYKLALENFVRSVSW